MKNFIQILLLTFILILTQAQNQDQSLVQIDIYYDSQCKASLSFFSGPFNQYMNSRLGQFININLYPHGNQIIKTNDNTQQQDFQCQQGDEECYGNKLQGCIVDLMNQSLNSHKFIVCLEQNISVNDTFDNTAVACMKKLGTQPYQAQQILICALGQQGNDLQSKYHQQLEDLNHTQIPWIVINGQSQNQQQHEEFLTNMNQYICEQIPEIKQNPRASEICNNITFKEFSKIKYQICEKEYPEEQEKVKPKKIKKVINTQQPNFTNQPQSILERIQMLGPQIKQTTISNTDQQQTQQTIQQKQKRQNQNQIQNQQQENLNNSQKQHKNHLRKNN